MTDPMTQILDWAGHADIAVMRGDDYQSLADWIKTLSPEDQARMPRFRVLPITVAEPTR